MNFWKVEETKVVCAQIESNKDATESRDSNVTSKYSVLATIVGIIGVTLSCVACSSSSSGNAAHCATPGGPVAGAVDSHCDGTVVTVDSNICSTSGNDPLLVDAGAGDPEEGNILYNAEGDDDDCKYHITWTSTAICENANVTFSLKLAAKSNGAPVTGAEPQIEATLSDTHPGQLSDQKAHETSPGNYSIGPVQFDAPGQWTVRFHFFPTGCDVPTSPHGHVAFYINVP